MFNWISDHRADIAAILILALAASFIWSIIYGYKQSRRLAKEQVFGDPERTLGGWYWAVCGVCADACLVLLFMGDGTRLFPDCSQ